MTIKTESHSCNSENGKCRNEEHKIDIMANKEKIYEGYTLAILSYLA